MTAAPCFVHCGQPACVKLGCVRVYNDRHSEFALSEHDFAGDGADCLICGEGRLYYLHDAEDDAA